MTTATNICNQALLLIGAKPITALTDDNIRAEYCNLMFSTTRDELLARHFWNFAVKRVELAEVEADPIYGYTKQYALPSDLIRLYQVEPENIIYRIEGRYLLTNTTGIKIKYIARPENESLFDPIFSEVLAVKLAIKLEYALSGKRESTAFLMAREKMLLMEARIMDAQADTPKPFFNNNWVNARYGVTNKPNNGDIL